MIGGKRGLRWAAMAAMLGLAGCATRPNAAVTRAMPAEMGKILSARPVMQRNVSAENGVLGALGTTGAARREPATEFIVERADGGIMSVIQPATTALVVGERVGIMRGVVTTLVPAGP